MSDGELFFFKFWMNRAAGNELFKQGKYADAIAVYRGCVSTARDNKVFWTPYHPKAGALADSRKHRAVLPKRDRLCRSEACRHGGDKV